MHLWFRSVQMEITKSQFTTKYVQKWLVCISARHVFHVFVSVLHNAPVRVEAVVKFSKVNEFPILYEAKCLLITKIRSWENCAPSLLVQVTARYLFLRRATKIRNKTQLVRA